ncbi:inner membrane transporter RhtA [Tistlia consotensis]|uniref:Inner membrane transporter RhtA n=1 Tax=Tistlia consotensis USBA 355 TaxID=560819 RepID=A0A1Y6CMX0_9PROT|nr:EamA family transporter [Tistlia consotensis]SMF78572.1 inner membrane transporter RhtA [Tistlia consotensis USBA 355]SNS18763.1 inner membrane transporter RhtA [Tistlia consotensis]
MKRRPESPGRAEALADRLPPQLWFLGSAVFHYLGPSFAVLLFAQVGVLGVAWLRIAGAAGLFLLWNRPWRVFARADREGRLLLLLLGACLAVMNCSFYLALERLPLSLVATIEFVGTVVLAAIGLASRRNRLALALAAGGAALLTAPRWASDPLGLAYAIANALLFLGYIVLGHRAAARGAGQGIQLLATAMAIAFLLVLPVGFEQARVAFSDPRLLLAGLGVGLCSSVVPYLCDQLAMARLPRNSYALMLALLPASATAIGALVLGQVPSQREMTGIALVIVGVALHRPLAAVPPPAPETPP